MTQYRPPRMKVMVVVGARPDFMKAAPIIERMKRFSDFLDPIFVHTGQHYDRQLSQLFFDELKMPKPDMHLEVGSGTHAEQTAKIMMEFEKVVLENTPHLIVVVGDVNSTLACALVAAKCKVLIAHIEAGLRSFDMSMPEEINRIMTDRITDFHFTTESSACQNLINERADENAIFFVGNVMIESLLNHIKIAQSRGITNQLGLEMKNYALLTLHRPENVDDSRTLKNILGAVNNVAEKVPVIFPCHPRTRLSIDKYKLSSYFGETGIRLIDPVGYLDFLKLESEAAMRRITIGRLPMATRDSGTWPSPT